MTTAQSTTRQADQTPDRSRELERAITEALVVALGKRAAHRALRHTRAHPHPARQRKLLQVAGYLAGYGALITYGWYQRRSKAIRSSLKAPSWHGRPGRGCRAIQD